jgi:hypothetical protein
MRTIGTKIRDLASAGGAPARCACGVPWPRNKLRRGADGLLHCPDEKGRDLVELDQANAAATPKGITHSGWPADGETLLSSTPVERDAEPILAALSLAQALRYAAAQAGLVTRFCLVAEAGLTGDENDLVSSWTDVEGGASFVAAGGVRPLWTESDPILGGRASIKGDGGDDVLACAARITPSAATTPFYSLLVGYQTGSVAGGRLLGHSGFPGGAVLQDGLGGLLHIGTVTPNTGAAIGQGVAIESHYRASGSFLRVGSVEMGTVPITNAGAVSRTLLGGSIPAAAALGLAFEALGTPTDAFRQRARALVAAYYGSELLV